MEDIKEFIPYLIHHPMHALGVVMVSGVALYIWRTHNNKKNNNTNNHCKCNQLLPQILSINDKIDRQNDKICEIQSQVSYLYGKANGKFK